jgi:5'-phosphate synthase pdxT subunit
LQGDFALHAVVLNDLGASVCEVRTADDLEALEALVIPGGESTTLRKLMKRAGIWDSLRERRRRAFPVLGTCAGLILMAHSVEGARPDEDTLDYLGVSVVRNAYGRQRESLVARISLNLNSGTPDSVDAVFIRAPAITSVSPEVRVLAEYRGKPVLVANHCAVGATFHPEAVPSSAIHGWFLNAFVKAKM